MKSNYLCNIFLLIINLIIPSISIISFPFNLKNENSYLYYNSSYFFKDNFRKELLLELNIGTPPQKTTGILNQDSSCFYFNKGELGKYNYFPIKSSSFKINDKLNDYYKLKTGNELFIFQENKIYKLNFLLINNSSSVNEMYIPIIGLGFPYFYIGRALFYPCSNFIFDLRQQKNINKLIYSLQYINKTKGEFIIGEELFEYKPKKYLESLYHKTYYGTNLSINFDSIYIRDKLNSIDYMINKSSNNKLKEGSININSGFIIGTNEYKNYIDQFYFNKLINKNICKIEILNYNPKDKSNNDKRFLNCDFYLYVCNSDFFGKKKKINYYNEFPNLVFNSKKLEYNFEFTNEDLFKQYFEKYYFLVIL